MQILGRTQDIVKGSIVALVSPFLENEEIDFEAVSKLIQFHVEEGTQAILVNGTTGENPSIDDSELSELVQFAVEQAAGRLPIYAGTAANCTKHAIKKSCIAEKAGAQALLIANPYYNKPSEKGIFDYYHQIIDHTESPIILYNVPSRTGYCMSAKFMLSLAERFPNRIRGVKEASGNLGLVMELIQHKPQSLSVYAGDDSLALPIISLGGAGCISVVANQVPRPFRALVDAALNHSIKEAQDWHYKLLNLMNLNFAEPNPIPVKTCLAEMGLIKEVFRSPICPLSSSKLREQLKGALKELGIQLLENKRNSLVA